MSGSYAHTSIPSSASAQPQNSPEVKQEPNEVVSVRELGYATAQEQLECGIVAIAVPVRDPSRRVIASINCSSELARNDLQTLVATRLAPLRETAAQIEQALERFPALAHAIGASYG